MFSGDMLKELKQFTIEDLIEICTKLEARQKMVKSLKTDEISIRIWRS